MTRSQALFVLTQLMLASALGCAAEVITPGSQREALLRGDLCISLFGAPCDDDTAGAGGAEDAAGAGGADPHGGTGAGQGGGRFPSDSDGHTAGVTAGGSLASGGGDTSTGEGGIEAIDVAPDRTPTDPTPNPAITQPGVNEPGVTETGPDWRLSGGSCSASSAAPAHVNPLSILLAFAPLVMVTRRARRRSAPTC